MYAYTYQVSSFKLDQMMHLLHINFHKSALT